MLEVEFELDTVLVVESDEGPENITVLLARGLLGTPITINIIANIAGGGASTWSICIAHYITTYML